MKKIFFKITFYSILIIFTFFNESKTFKYSEIDIENYLLPRPALIKKGDKNIIISEKVDFKIIMKPNKNFQNLDKNKFLLGRLLFEKIKDLYLNLFRGNFNKIKDLKLKTQSVFQDEINSESNKLIYKTNINKNLRMFSNLISEFSKVNSPNNTFSGENANQIRNADALINNFTINIEIDIEDFSIKKFSDFYKNNFQKIESYDLKIYLKDKNNLHVSLKSYYLNGLLRAFETLSQLLNLDSQTKSYKIYNLPIEINDKPAFAYRGVMIDTARHYIDISKIKEILDGMLYSKLNILHWHLTDDEYFSLKFEKSNLMLKENYEKFAYSKEEIKDLVDYAFIRGITIIPEIDHPAHTRSWKNLIYTPLKEDVVITKGETGILNPSKDKLNDLILELLGKTIIYFKIYKSNDKGYLHLGGDEIESQMWEIDEIKDYMKKKKLDNISDLENFFFKTINSKLDEIYNTDNNDTKFIYWVDENLKRFYDIYYKENSILMYWGLNANFTNFISNFNKNQTSIELGLNKTKDIIIASGDYLYLDCGQGNKYGDGTWCGDYKTWKKIYSIPLFKNYENFQILGAQVSLFGELADNYNIVGKIFPRAFSISEKLWNIDYNNKIDSDKNKEMFIKIINHNERLNLRGVNSISITSQLCENDPEVCIDKIN